MKNKKVLNIQGAVLDKYQLESYLEKIASDHVLKDRASLETYPINRLNENYIVIKQVYKLLNEHIKMGIPIHPAGEWILDNLYVIEEIVKNITKDLTLKKYKNFVSLSNGRYAGFARIYVLAAEMVAYTDGKIDNKNLEEMLRSYQNKKALSMDEIWNIGTFLQIALIENIRQISERVYLSQIQKYKVENILSKTIDRENQSKYRENNVNRVYIKSELNTFVEYMSYRLKKFGRQAYPYLKILEEEVNKAGTTTDEIIKKEHFDIAVKKLSMGNCITSLKNISRINFLEIFERINGVEDILKQDPAKQYEKMDVNTKVLYRNTIKEISEKTKLSEIYIAQKCLELSTKGEERKSHVGYYLVSDGKYVLLNYLQNKNKKYLTKKQKAELYVFAIWLFTVVLDLIFIEVLYKQTSNFLLSIIMFVCILLPIENIVTKIIQFVLSKTVKPKLIPKLDFQNGIPEEYATYVVIPTILKSKEQVKKLMEKLEVFYIANKSSNLYLALLGDCSSSDKEEEEFDAEVIEAGVNEAKKLNEKYANNSYDTFGFVYRKRIWNDKENCYLGWERKRGILNQFNEYVLGKIKNPFRINTLTQIPKIKYVITIDSDTDLTLNSGLEMIGAMAHILNRPELNEEKDLVVSGHGLIAPRVGVNLEETQRSVFSMLYAGKGGTDSYTNAISDLYQDNFDEGIYSGKGIYDLEVFETVLNNEIKENTVLSHDLLEGSYLRSGYASDIMLMDGCPTNYMSYKKRLYRWTRGDYQIILWLKDKIENKNGEIKRNPLNFLSKYKILSNIFRSKLETATLITILYSCTLSLVLKCNIWGFFAIALITMIIPFVLDLINFAVCKKENDIKTKSFTKSITGLSASFYRAIINVMLIPDKAWMDVKAEVKTLYRLCRSKKHLLEWETSEEAERNSKKDLYSYFKNMCANIIVGIVILLINFWQMDVGVKTALAVIAVLWIIAPVIMHKISKKAEAEEKKLSQEDKNFLLDTAYKTWLYFKENLNEKNNFLPPDNYQGDRKPNFIDRTSSTNIGLALLSVIASYDLKFETLEDTIDLLYKMVDTISGLQKWNGHLYNWYNIQTLEPLVPRYISSVDSGNFVGYLYVVLQFLEEAKDKLKEDEQAILKINSMLEILENIIGTTDFSKLYDSKNRLFSVGYNVEENKLTDSYYDLLASEARQTSLVAIAKKDISSKHWHNLSRTLTTLNNYKGLVSWSGTAFEYLMPNINIPQYPGSILDESCKFMIMSQKMYANKLGVPWGFSEAAFNLKDLYNNYQYKAFGIPWLGLKRGLADEIVVSSYGTILALPQDALGVMANIKILKEQGMYGQYGFYESIDYTPNRVRKNCEIVKTYMAHHQGLILLSIDNFFNDNVLQKRFMKNPQMQAIKILLEEKMPENMVITKEEKEKVEKIKYVDYEDYSCRKYNKIDENLNISNVIANDKYSIIMDQYGNGYSNYNGIQINRFKPTDDEAQGIIFFIKDIRNKRIWTNTYSRYLAKPDKYSVSFYPDMNKIVRLDGSARTTTKIIVATDEAVEIRRLELKNMGITEQILEVTSYIEPILSTKMQDYAHKAFNNLFVSFEYIEGLNTIIVKRNARDKDDRELYMGIKLYQEDDINGELEYEIDKEKFYGRCNLNLPREVINSSPFSKRIEHVTDPIVALKKIINIQPEESKILDLIISVAESKEEAIANITKYSNNETVQRTFELSKARVEAETRYLGLKAKDIEVYQKLMSYLLFKPKVNISKNNIKSALYPTSELWKYGISGDLPILLIRIKNVNDIDVVKEAINAYEYWRSKGINVDLVILNEEKESYENYVKDAVESAVLNKNLSYLFNIKGGIYCLNNINKNDEKQLLRMKATMEINASNGSLEEHINEYEAELKEAVKQTVYESKKEYMIEEREEKSNINLDEKNLKYFNEYGGFSQDGKEYLIKVNKNAKLPTVWSHIMANEHFGTLVTESMGGYTWKDNSRLNRLTAWANNQVTDVPSEIIYLKDLDTGQKWSLGLNPMPDDNDYYVTYGFGYAKYAHSSSGIEQENTVFIPQNDSVKINLLHFENRRPESRRLKIVYYIKPVMDEDEIKSNGNINVEFNNYSNVVLLNNTGNETFDGKMFVSSSEKINSYTGSKISFFKNTSLNNPDGLEQLEFNGENSYGEDGILAINLNIKLEAMSGKDVAIIIGEEASKSKCQDIAYKYSDINNCREELFKIKKYWSDMISKIQVETPVESTNILLNGWLIYQTIEARLLARTGYYQSGGAYGFRDQLQDSMAVKYFLPELTRNQIIKHSKHQFLEGDVEHWWHEETKRGIRTRFSDDLLWLPYVTCDYINFTGDYEILDENTPYIQGKILEKDENERYDFYGQSDVCESIYEHCVRAIEKSLQFGENGLPLIGSGDWNDGFSNVGVKGKGESVWLGFFMYDVLRKFIPICDYKQDIQRAERYAQIQEKLRKALNTNGWDGRWYKRAFMDDGEILGSLQNEECRIDSISQSWAVISGAGDNDKKYISMESLENHLVDKADGIIKLLDPPFEKSKLNPGYIKSYVSGTRENGGQYTHGAIWVIIAMALLNLDDKAFEYYKMINPIEHSRTREAASKYKVEPYVVAADVYGKYNLAGRGGWTWYTGSSSWMYIAGIKYILGLDIENGMMKITPHIPANWEGYSIRYKYGESLYNIKVTKKHLEKKVVIINGKVSEHEEIALDSSGQIYNVEITI